MSDDSTSPSLAVGVISAAAGVGALYLAYLRYKQDPGLTPEVEPEADLKADLKADPKMEQRVLARRSVNVLDTLD